MWFLVGDMFALKSQQRFLCSKLSNIKDLSPPFGLASYEKRTNIWKGKLVQYVKTNALWYEEPYSSLWLEKYTGWSFQLYNLGIQNSKSMSQICNRGMQAGLEFQILRGTHFKATAEGHLRPLHIQKNTLKYRGTKAKSDGHQRPWPRWPWGNLSPVCRIALLGCSSRAFCLTCI